MNKETIAVVAVTPVMLNSLTEIAKTFARSAKTVRKWHSDGAPIVREGADGSTRYSAELNALQAWRLAVGFNQKKSP